MRISSLRSFPSERTLEASALLGILAGLGMLIPAFLVPEIGFLALPALLLLLPSLLFALR